MRDRTIEQEIVIDAPAEVVWRTITEPDQISEWFAPHVELDLREGGAGTFSFGDEAGTRTVALVVDTVDPPHRFAFRWGRLGDEAPAMQDTVLVAFTLTAEGGERTRLRVTETGLDATPWPDGEKDRYVDDHRDGWQTHLGRLRGLFATG